MQQLLKLGKQQTQKQYKSTKYFGQLLFSLDIYFRRKSLLFATNASAVNSVFIVDVVEECNEVYLHLF